MTKPHSISLRLPVLALLGSAALLCPASLIAQSAAPAVRPAPRIVSPIDETQMVALKGNTHPAANPQNDRGPVSPSLPMTDLILVLSRSPQQQAAFDAFVTSQYDQSSPNFHQWLSPDDVGAQFGPSATDIATISNWLAGHGFTVNEVTKDHMSIRFSGNAAQVQSAFHTQIHNLSVKGVAHIANMTDPQIPAALAPAIVGIKALHNFFPRPAHHLGGTVQKDAATGKWQRLTTPATSASTPASPGSTSRSLAAAKPTSSNVAGANPQYGISVGGSSPYLVEDVGPWDFATIYNILPLWNAGTPIDGTGQKIAIAGTSDIDVGQSAASETGANGNNDILTFRTYFGLPSGNAANTPIRISGNSQPLTVCTDTTGTVPYATNPCGIDDLTENSLDVEWSASIAKNAQIILVSSYPASATDDNLYDSESYIVNHLTAPIMNVSYGLCELSNGTAANVEYYDLWQQAAAEGISVFVAAGDSGSASCDAGYSWAASGLAVSGLASTPWNTAVGGTDFNWCNPDTANGSGNTACAAAPYWSSTPITSPGSTAAVTTALGYVPEVPWNESCANPVTLKWVQDAETVLYGFSPQPVSNTEEACNFLLDFNYSGLEDGYYGLGTQYPYITYLLETVGGSGGASNCVVGTATTNTNTGEISGCTASTGAGTTGQTNNPDTGATQASLATYNNGWPKPSWQTGVSGIPADGVRDLPDVSFFASDGYTSSSAYLICVSQENSGDAPCTYSTYTEPFYQEVGGTSVATPAMAGVMALINQKKGVPQGFASPELYKLAASQSYGSCSAESVGSTCMFNDIDQGTNAMPCDAVDTTPNCTASFSTLGYSDAAYGLGILTGDSTGAGYDLATGLGSLNVANVVTNWVSAIGSGKTTVTVTPASETVSLGASLSVTVTVASSPSGGTTPTGTVTLSGGGYTSASVTLTSGAAQFTIPAGALAGGSVTLTANYFGDPTYAPNSNTAGVTVTKLSASVSASPSPASIQSNQQTIITGTVTGSGATPTGTVTVSYGSTYTSSAATLNSSGQYSVTITPNSLPGGTPNQVDSLNVNYSGDGNYSPASTTTSVTVTLHQVLTPTMTVATTPVSTVYSGSSVLVTVSVSGPPATPANPTPTGTVTLYGPGYFTAPAPATATLSNGTATFTIPANALNSNPNPALSANDILMAAYQGDPNYGKVTQTATLNVYESVFSAASTGPSGPVTPGTAATASDAVSSTTNYTGSVVFTSAGCVLTAYSGGASASNVDNPTCTLATTPTGNGTITLANGVVTSGSAVFAIHTYSATFESELRRPVIGPGAPSMQLAKLSTPANPHAPWHAPHNENQSTGTALFGAAGGAALAALFLFIIPGGARKWSKMLGAILFIVSLTLVIEGCGGGGISGGGTTTPPLPTPTVTVTPASNTIQFNMPLSVMVSVTGSAGTATGGVSLTGGGYSSPTNSGTLTNGSTTFSIPVNQFTGTNGGNSITLTASYQGSTAYNPASNTAPITVDYVPTVAGAYTFTVTPTSSPSITLTSPITFTVTVN